MWKNNGVLHPQRHLILYAKGHYIVSSFENDLMFIALADGQDGKDPRKLVSKLAAQIMKESDDISGEMFSHLSFVFSRGYEMMSEEVHTANEGTVEEVIKYVELDEIYDILDRLLIEAALAIIMRWKVPEQFTLGDPDPQVLPVRDPAVEKRKQ